MTTRDYLTLATIAYEKFAACQARIDKIEQRALIRYDGNKGVAAHELKTASEFWLYRDLCSDRDIHMKVAQLNASMAAIA
jgi:hypothetical protein